jgi:hypothetical protein
VSGVTSSAPLDALESAFRRRAVAVKTLGVDRWRVTLENGRPFEVDAWLEWGWLVAATDVREAPPARYWEIVQLNAQAAPLVRFAISGPLRATHLRAELPLTGEDGDELSGTRHLPALLSGFESGMGLLDGCDPPPRPPTAAPENERGTDLLALCHEAGWEAETRPGDRLVVSLTTEGAAEVLVARRQPDGLRLSVDLGGCSPASAAGRMAMGGLLLSATGHVRMARAVIRKLEGTERACLEVVFDSEPTPEEMHHALRALEIATGLAAQELKVLRDEGVAQGYVLGRRWCGSGEMPNRR